MNSTGVPVDFTGPLNMSGATTLSLLGNSPYRAMGISGVADSGTLSVGAGATLIGYAVPGGGANSLGAATIGLNSTATLRLCPTFTSAPSGSSPGLFLKGYTGVASFAATNFLGASQAVTAGTVSPYTLLNVVAGGAVYNNANSLNFPSSASFQTTTSFQFTGLITITTAGVYNFSSNTDDPGNLFVDGNPPIVTSVNTVTNSFYLTSGVHIFNLRQNNNGGNGTLVVQYQGPDTNNVLTIIPITVFTTAPNSSIAAGFGNNLTVSATSTPSIDISSDTSLGNLTMTGSGAGTLLSVTANGNVNTLTFTGSTTLSDNLTLNNLANPNLSTANIFLAGGVQALGGQPFTMTKNGVNTLSIGGIYSSTGNLILDAGILSFLNNGTGNNGTIVHSNPILLGASGATINVDNNGANTGNTVSFPALLTPVTALATTTTFTGGDGYKIAFNGLALPGTTGQDTILVPTTTNLTISGAVTSQMSGFATGNYDTLYLDGTSTGNVLSANVGEAGTFVPLVGGYTRIIKQNAGTWTISGTGSTYTGITQVLNGTLKAGAVDIIPSNNQQGINVTATGAGITATFDCNGFNQTFSGGTVLTLGGSTTTSTPVITGAASTITLGGDVSYVATNNPLGGIISAATLDLGAGTRNFTVGDSTSAANDLSISSVIQNGGLTKAGAGTLAL